MEKANKQNQLAMIDLAEPTISYGDPSYMATSSGPFILVSGQASWPLHCHRSCVSTVAGGYVYEKDIRLEEEAMKW